VLIGVIAVLILGASIAAKTVEDVPLFVEH
jgi:hypothetical protein